ncbi:bactofilin family protein [Pseudoalteromonas ulvae]|uniref:Cell shape determination protein CcmA n=1 Tax=Pseudoalteromonas ulvae TaxID=107327 RepID=A0A244CVB2_PSEDV|nr:polymer-forming cytoskeletal protein [Pseudoalteromonas ulvae]OUL59366.1 hypothetical protein B1199_03605 [Pseudoalteromonas ulvae]
MFSKKLIPSLISADVTLEGEIKSAGAIQLDGTINGQIAVNHLTIGEQGQVIGTITAEEVVIKGRVTGSVTATSVILEKSAQVQGDIFHGTLSIATGAEVDGTVKKLETENVTDLSQPKVEKRPTPKSQVAN